MVKVTSLKEKITKWNHFWNGLKKKDELIFRTEGVYLFCTTCNRKKKEKIERKKNISSLNFRNETLLRDKPKWKITLLFQDGGSNFLTCH